MCNLDVAAGYIPVAIYCILFLKTLCQSCVRIVLNIRICVHTVSPNLEGYRTMGSNNGAEYSMAHSLICDGVLQNCWISKGGYRKRRLQTLIWQRAHQQFFFLS